MHLRSYECICDLANAFTILQMHLRSCKCICDLANWFAILQMHLRSCKCICNLAYEFGILQVQMPVRFRFRSWVGSEVVMQSNLKHRPWRRARERRRRRRKDKCKEQFVSPMPMCMYCIPLVGNLQILNEKKTVWRSIEEEAVTRRKERRQKMINIKKKNEKEEKWNMLEDA